MSSNSSPEKKAFIKVITWTFSIVAALTTINALFIVNSVGTGIKLPFPRNVASLPPVEVVTKEMISPTIEFNCRNIVKNFEIKTKAFTTRVNFKGCKSVGRVTNESNKNQGDVFFLPNEDWTSDFIFLSPGKNTLLIPVEGKIHSISVLREEIKKEQPKKAL